MCVCQDDFHFGLVLFSTVYSGYVEFDIDTEMYNPLQGTPLTNLATCRMLEGCDVIKGVSCDRQDVPEAIHRVGNYRLLSSCNQAKYFVNQCADVWQNLAVKVISAPIG